MRLLADENFPLASVLYLRNRNFDILSIGSDHQGISDKSVLEFAIEQKRTLLTFDRDFGELIFKEGFHPIEGVVLLRLSSFLPEEPGQIIDKIIKENNIDFKSAITVVDESGLRQRKF